MRAGTAALPLLTVPLNVDLLIALEQEPRSLADLRSAVGAPPTTMRSHLRNLTDLGLMVRRRQSEFPGSVDYELLKPGRELLAVAAVVDDWLAGSPEGPLSLAETAGRNALKALVGGWSAAIVRALATQPLSLTDLNRLISSLNYPSLERRFGAMRLAGLIEARRGNGRGRPYAATPWLRRAVLPVAAAIRWELLYLPEDAPAIARSDIESAFLLAVPLARLSPDVGGSCRLAVEVRDGEGGTALAGVQIEVVEGRIVSCHSRLRGHVDASVTGTLPAWMRALIEEDVDGLDVMGDRALFWGALAGLREALEPARQRT